jgi:hypothetical protein
MPRLADAMFVAPIKLQHEQSLAIDRSLEELEEGAVIVRVGDAIADAATQRRDTTGEDARQAARRAAVEIATATLSASSTEMASHSDDVDVISEGIGRKLGLVGQGLDDVMVAARLHDIGKIAVPARIIDKPGPLDEAEWAVIRRHTIIGEQILLSVPELRSAARLVRHSHERWDGGGYPDGLAGEEIPLGSRIVFCADAFHAIRCDRPYRRGRSPAEALAEIRACAGAQFDPDVVEALVGLSSELRARSNGTRPRSRRAGRLMALMLVVSVGACGSAFARSGLMLEAKRPHSLLPPGHARTVPTADGLQGLAPGLLSPGAPIAGTSVGLPPSPSANGAHATGLLSLVPTALGLPSGSAKVGVPVPGTAPVSTGSPKATDQPKAGDSGQGGAYVVGQDSGSKSAGSSSGQTGGNGNESGQGTGNSSGNATTGTATAGNSSSSGDSNSGDGNGHGHGNGGGNSGDNVSAGSNVNAGGGQSNGGAHGNKGHGGGHGNGGRRGHSSSSGSTGNVSSGGSRGGHSNGNSGSSGSSGSVSSESNTGSGSSASAGSNARGSGDGNSGGNGNG